ncbi:MAG TPA: phosphoribosylglycinamide formyltransferase [Longimicrobiales bacterium]
MRIAVFASGGGTNLQALLDHFNGDVSRGARVSLVVCDRAGAVALTRAADAGVASALIPVTGRAPGDVGRDTLQVLAEHDISLIVLAGYLRLVPVEVIEKYRDRIVNIHPALLPAFGGGGMYGRRVHEAVIAAGCRVSGATVHLVDEHYDQGRILAQWPVPVLAGDTAESLAARVLRVEHVLLPAAVEAVAAWLARGESLGAASGGGAGRGDLFFTLDASTPGDVPTEFLLQ